MSRKRMSANPKIDKGLFVRTANRTRPLNVKPTIRRGGIRM